MKAPYQIKRREVSGNILTSTKIYVFTLVNTKTDRVICEVSSRQPIAPASLRGQQSRLNTTATLGSF
jgi:hypothetical protein